MRAVFRDRQTFGLLITFMVMLVITAVGHAQERLPADPVALPAPPADRHNIDALMTQAEANGFVRLIVGLQTTGTERVVDAQAQILDALAGAEVSALTTYRYIPYVALKTDSTGLTALARSPYVRSIQPDRVEFAALSGSTTQIGAAGPGGAWELGYKGNNQVIAVLDSGVNGTHPALFGSLIGEACFSSNGPAEYDSVYSSVCPDGLPESIAPGSAADCDPSIANCWHGTHVAGIMVSHDAEYTGVAPEASIVAIQVFTRVDGPFCQMNGFPSPCAVTLPSDQMRALEHVYTIRDQFAFSAITMSLGAGLWSDEASCDNDNSGRKAIIDLLRAEGIPVLAAAGNAGAQGQIMAPACISSAFAVGAVDSSDTITNFSNMAPFVDFVGPGQAIVSSLPGGTFGPVDGTSMATPHVAATWALIRSANADMPLESITALMANSGVPISHNAQTFPRIDIKAALNQSAVLLQTPEETDVISTVPLDMQWSRIPDAIRYKVILKHLEMGVKTKVILEQADCSETSCTVTLNNPLANIATYKWKVKAVTSHGKRKSLPRTFTTAYLTAPVLLEPAADAVFNVGNELTALTWEPVPTADRYKIIIKDTSLGVKIVKQMVEGECTDTICTFTLPPEAQAALLDGHGFWWRVQARNVLFGKEKSEKRAFSISKVTVTGR